MRTSWYDPPLRFMYAVAGCVSVFVTVLSYRAALATHPTFPAIGLIQQMDTTYRRDDRVTVTDGDWAGFEAVVEKVDSESELAVVLVLIGFTLIKAELPLACLKRQMAK